jgi:hypothetical protein
VKTNNVNNRAVKVFTTDKVYLTMDAYTAGFLSLRDHTPSFIQQDSKVVFSFVANEKLFSDLSDFNNGAVIEASRLVFAIKTLKSQIHTMRRNKEYESGFK